MGKTIHVHQSIDGGYDVSVGDEVREVGRPILFNPHYIIVIIFVLVQLVRVTLLLLPFIIVAVGGVFFLCRGGVNIHAAHLVLVYVALD